MTGSIHHRTARILRGVARVLGWGGSSLRQMRIRCLYPTVHFEGRCFLEKGARITAVGDARVTVRGCHVSRSVRIEAGKGAEIEVGADFIGPGSMLVAQSSLTVGPGSKIAEMVVIRDADHDHSRPLSDMAFVSEPVVIGGDVWVGAGATILKGVDVGDHATIAAGAVVTSSVPAHSTVGGVPARLLR